MFAGVLGGAGPGRAGCGRGDRASFGASSGGPATSRWCRRGALAGPRRRAGGVVDSRLAGAGSRLGSAARAGACRAAVAWVVSVLVLDLAVYAQHVAMHKVPWLWPLHRVHHADVDRGRHDGRALPPARVSAVARTEGRGRRAGWRAGRRRVSVRGAAERHVDVQPRELAPAGVALIAPCGACRRHSGHAPRASLAGSARGRQQLRLQRALVGPPLRHVPFRAAAAARDDDARRVAVPQCG